jgi:hypothetical protein
MVKKEIKSNIPTILIILFLSVISFITCFSAAKAISQFIVHDNSNNTIEIVFINSTNNILNEGRNMVYFNNYYTAKELVKNNPLIETISYYDQVLDKTIGFVNIFGGVGKDFTIYPDRVYEINTRSQTILKLD